MATGMIVKALSGFYYVQTEDGIFQCRGRGNFRKRQIKPLVGDEVEFEAENRTDGYILDVFERKNELIRPPIANVDQALLVFSALEPDFSPLLLDRFLVHIEANGLEAIIIISKVDLLGSSIPIDILKYKEQYEKIGYTVLLTSTLQKDGIDQIIPYLDGKVSVVAGQSGVGKSSLLNSLKPELNIETNEISSHLGRGKHTTRHVELLRIGNGLVADTPGFSSLDFIDLETEDLSGCFPEMERLSADCKFRGCTHTSEPKCAVKAALEKEEIGESRMKHYLQFLEEIKNQKRRYD
ncbi:ribosome small subunit-dependent GTPase A [Halalkalibacter akibai]|uniref:Small ribosomal subunit biogenesis GTPase RsgA n=1 Tax=Halalkalibacter akibai (strain ATCC 43226 / DSM 21942 / CIP 109018 / JCM 9157 / 1139) TaxID=1236973 RepID=W4QP73_HALA3|nr:ribosome small subunit-dependent GTPase A [Halalkalibacter akibai]GAE33905.1 ribosome small subunit-stimulated GTPase EngC [Halalkalibacter akibai JCM 9157]